MHLDVARGLSEESRRASRIRAQTLNQEFGPSTLSEPERR